MTYVQPLTLLCLFVLAAGLYRLRHCKGFLLPALGVLILFLLTWPPVDFLLSWPLETAYPVRPFPVAPAQVIVVLSSSVHPPQTERPYAIAGTDTYFRCVHGAWLYKNWQAVPVLVSGGPPTKKQAPFAVTMREVLLGAGVPESKILIEDKSQSTYENALYSAKILHRHGIKTIALVVEAYAMPRAAAAFRRQGITVIPAPYTFRGFGPIAEELLPSWKALQRNENTLHEVLGLGWYWLRGRI